MKVSAKAEYACVALVELANRYAQQIPVSLKAVGEQYGISPAFLTQIFMQLKRAGLVTSVRGSSGGYQLARKPEAIDLAEILDAIDGPSQSTPALEERDDQPIIATLQRVWDKATLVQRQLLCGISLADLLRQAHEAGVVFYQI